MAAMLEVWIVIVLLVAIGLSMEAKLGRANRIARATHDLIKELLELQKAAKETKAAENAERPPPNVESRREEKKEPDPPSREATARQDVYRI
jgi:uncharacterized membrane protein